MAERIPVEAIEGLLEIIDRRIMLALDGLAARITGTPLRADCAMNAGDLYHAIIDAARDTEARGSR